jgi:MoaA/NifB/PqqE/SkfB family radical SAM enzyme
MAERKLCWRVTRYCNLHCVHCLAGHANLTRRDLMLDERLLAMARIIACDVTRITWTGGEPTLCEDLPALLNVAHSAGVASVLTTHGLALRPRLFSVLDSKLDRLRISFDGLRETHNRIRGGPVFDRAIHAVRLARDRGFTTEANVTVLVDNVDELPELLEYLAMNGASRIILLTLMRRESAIDNDIAAPNEQQRRKLFSRLKELGASVTVQLNNYDEDDDGYIVLESDGEILLCSDARGDASYGSVLSSDGTSLLARALSDQTLTHRSNLVTSASV